MKKALPWMLTFIALFLYPPAFLPFTEGKWVALTIAGLFSLGYIFRAPVIFPKFSFRAGLFFALLTLGMLAQLFWARPRGFLFVLSDRVSFFLIALAFWKSFRQGLGGRDFWAPLVVALFLSSLAALLPFASPGGFFGETNLAAEAIALMLLALMALPAPARTRPLIAGGFFLCAISLAVFFLSLRGEGWLLLDLLFSLVILGGMKDRGRAANINNKYFIQLRFVGIGLGLALALGVVGISGTPPRSWRQPLIPAAQRALWKETLVLARENPLGVGPGRFEFASLRPMAGPLGLEENQRVLSPGNEFLRYLIEDGLLLSLGYLAAWALLLAPAFRRKLPEARCVLASALFLGLGSASLPLFQNAFVVALTAVLAGLLVSVESGELRLRNRVGVNLFRLSAGALLGITLLAAFTSRTLEAREAQAGVACFIVPANWRACLQAARGLTNQGNYAAARYYVEGVLSEEPDNLIAEQQLVFIAGNQRRNLEACFLLWRFDDFYGGKSSQHERLLKNCQPKWLEYFAKKRPVRFYGRQKKVPGAF